MSQNNVISIEKEAEDLYEEIQNINKTNKSVLELTAEEARKFFLKDESYCNFDLPPYFKFEKLLRAVSKKLDGKDLATFQHGTVKVRECENVNHVIFNNKNAKYAWRPMSLIHPAIYASLVNAITEECCWKHILSKFQEYERHPKIDCLSVPVEARSKKSDKAEQILHWWDEIEQRSIEFSLDYDCMAVTDISDCYGSVYTHSIVWALHGKEDARNKRNDKSLIGNVIDWHLQDMNLGQTNSIPQGSVLMDLFAEIVLGYADVLLGEKLKETCADESDYHILRYRDDYRIFTRELETGETITKILTEVLMGLGLKLNPTKTVFTKKLIEGPMKPEKRHWITHKQYAHDIREQLIIIHELAEKFPNSGGLIKALTKFYKRITGYKNIKANIPVLISIVTDIAFRNPRIYPLCCAVISKFLEFMEGDSQKIAIIDKIRRKFEKLPNTSHLDIWLQRISAPINRNIQYNAPLCNALSETSQGCVLWNTDWLKGDVKKMIDKHSVVDENIFDALTPVISNSEVDLFSILYEGGV